ncbi:vWA domain-containing protein [Thermovenabulum sp.]
MMDNILDCTLFQKGIIKTDYIDNKNYKRICNTTGKLQDVSKTISEIVISPEIFLRDVIYYLYKVKPEKEDEIENKNNEKIFDTITNLEDVKEIKQQCQLNMPKTIVATYTILDKIMKEIKKDKELEEKLIQQKNDDINQIINQVKRETQKNDGNNREEDEINTKLEEIYNNVSKEIKKELQQQFEEIDTIENIINTFGKQAGKEAGIYEGLIDPDKVTKIIEYISHNNSFAYQKIKKITDLAGRMKLTYKEGRKDKVNDVAREEYKGIVLGDDLSNLLPYEVNLLKKNKKEFTVKYLNKELAVYEVETKHNIGYGPIILCIDESSSMKERMADYTKEIWAKALMMLILQRAYKQKRKFAVIQFTSHIGGITHFDPRKDNSLKILNVVLRHYNGGTNFREPIDKAIEIIKSEKVYKRADIIFITDGEDTLGREYIEKIKEEKKKHNIRFITMLIGGDSEELRQISDQYMNSDFVDEQIVSKIVKMI